MKGGNASKPHQLPLGLLHPPAMTRDDFLVADANREAAAVVDRWPDWPWPTVILCGPAGSGKSHLVEIWRLRAEAAVIAAKAIEASALEQFAVAGAVAVEDLDEGAIDEAAMFHLINLARERAIPLLLTSKSTPALLAYRLPDLVSRLRAAHLVHLGSPDEELLRRVLVKLFADRQLAVDSSVVDYIVARIERSLGAASAVVDVLDRAALSQNRAITRHLAAAALADHSRPGPETDET